MALHPVLVMEVMGNLVLMEILMVVVVVVVQMEMVLLLGSVEPVEVALVLLILPVVGMEQQIPVEAEEEG